MLWQKPRRVLTVEDHNIIMVSRTAVGDVAAKGGKGFASEAGILTPTPSLDSRRILFSHYGFDENGIVDTVRDMMKIEVEEDDDWDDEV